MLAGVQCWVNVTKLVGLCDATYQDQQPASMASFQDLF